MTENPYAIRVEELLDSARVPAAELVVEQPERRLYGDAGSGPSLLPGEGILADGDCG